MSLQLSWPVSSHRNNWQNQLLGKLQSPKRIKWRPLNTLLSTRTWAALTFMASPSTINWSSLHNWLLISPCPKESQWCLIHTRISCCYKPKRKRKPPGLKRSRKSKKHKQEDRQKCQYLRKKSHSQPLSSKSLRSLCATQCPTQNWSYRLQKCRRPRKQRKTRRAQITRRRLKIHKAASALSSDGRLTSEALKNLLLIYLILLIIYFV